MGKKKPQTAKKRSAFERSTNHMVLLVDGPFHDLQIEVVDAVGVPQLKLEDVKSGREHIYKRELYKDDAGKNRVRFRWAAAL